MKTQYELMMVLSGNHPIDDAKKTRTLIEKVLSETNATIDDMTVLGKKELSFPIHKATDGVYVLAIVSGTGVQAGKLQNQVKLMPEVLRYMLTVKEA